MSKNIFILLSFPFSSKLLMLKSKCQVCAQEKNNNFAESVVVQTIHIFSILVFS